MSDSGDGDAVVAEGLVKRYGAVTALDGLSLRVPQGSVLGVLGPNGAGKTTAVRVLTTLLKPDAGTATVAGIDVIRRPDKVRKLIGVSGQYAAVDEHLTGYENLDMVGRLYHLGRGPSRSRARELRDRFDLSEAADRPVKTYSGGMRRRLDLAGALVADPQVLFLDEPTTGLDPRSRADMWLVIAELVAAGTSLLLTTQYLEEADRLANQIMVIDHGKVIAEGTSDELKTQMGGERLELVIADPDRLAEVRDLLAEVGAGEVAVNSHTRALSVPVSGGTSALVEVLRRLDAVAVAVQDIGVRRPTLDDVFLSLTGHAATVEEAEDGAELDKDKKKKAKSRTGANA
jgi:ABC-2 type transport system ATP-binding protein